MKSKPIKLRTPLGEEKIAILKAGDMVHDMLAETINWSL